jgi:hypothetical protein
MNTTYKVLTRTPHNDKYPFRTFREYNTLAEAMAAAARLERNTDLETLVEMPNNALAKVPLRLLELTA